jgi:hypothetical protein
MTGPGQGPVPGTDGWSRWRHEKPLFPAPEQEKLILANHAVATTQAISYRTVG